MLVVELSSTPFSNRWSTAMDIALALSSRDLNPQHLPSRNKHPIFNSNPETAKHCNAKVIKHSATFLLKLNMFTCLFYFIVTCCEKKHPCVFKRFTEALCYGIRRLDSSIIPQSVLLRIILSKSKKTRLRQLSLRTFYWILIRSISLAKDDLRQR